MAFNPAKTQEHITSPIERASSLNDPEFVNAEGYYPYDLSHSSFITPRFGEVTPTMSLHTVSGDRIVVADKTKTILNRIDGNMLNELQQYIDSFYIPMRSLFPINYEKLLPNPTKGDDLPNSALPQFPFARFIYNYFTSDITINLTYNGATNSIANNNLFRFGSSDIANGASVLGLARLMMLAFVLSRGQLLDYLNFQPDGFEVTKNSVLQGYIDDFFTKLQTSVLTNAETTPATYSLATPSLVSNSITIPAMNSEISELEQFRDILYSAFEAGKYVFISPERITPDVYTSAQVLVSYLLQIFPISPEFTNSNFITLVDSEAAPFSKELFINLSTVLAYQQCIAHYYTRDSIDNIFNADLYMQNLRSVMFPSVDGYSSEPTFDFNGVGTEYDLISAGAAFRSLIYYSTSRPGKFGRQYVFMSLMFVLRRSLRYGDYFSTARPQQLANASQHLYVNGDQGVSGVEITQNLLTTRYLNAANYIGSSFIPYMQSMTGVTPTTDNCEPKFLAHRVIPIVNDVTTNTSEEQGKQTTNLVGYSDNSAFDVFIDDYGVILSLCSFDVLPVYTTGIENTFRFADRFDYFNPMLQNIGDQQIMTSELVGFPGFINNPFGWTMRNAEYKYKLSKAHGAFCNNRLNGYLLKYPLYDYSNNDSYDETKINPDFIRDKPVYLDRVVPSNLYSSPADYFHFVISVNNKVNAARKIQLTPALLF